jgi:hypothetical protein
MTRFDIQPNSLCLFTSQATLVKQPRILRRRTTKLRAERSFLRSLWFYGVSNQSPRLFSPVLRASQQPVQNVSTNRRRSQRSMLEKGNFTLKVTNNLATFQATLWYKHCPPNDPLTRAMQERKWQTILVT